MLFRDPLREAVSGRIEKTLQVYRCFRRLSPMWQLAAGSRDDRLLPLRLFLPKVVRDFNQELPFRAFSI